MNREERLVPNGIPRYVRLYDNNGEYTDRYTVVFTRLNCGYCIYASFNNNPFHPSHGFYQHGEFEKMIDRPKYSHLGKRIKFQDLNDDCQMAVMQDYKVVWRLK